MTGIGDPNFEYETDYIKLHWQIHALKGQLYELERERNRTGNLLWVIRQTLIHALRGLGVVADYANISDAELVVKFTRVVQYDSRFSMCPNAGKLNCRPSAMKFTRDGDPVHCEDCGWDIRDDPLPIKRRNPPPEADNAGEKD